MSKFALVAIPVLALVGCDGIGNSTQYEFFRTSETPLVVKFQKTVPVNRQECHTYSTYGPDSSCGSYETCSKSNEKDRPSRDDLRSDAHDRNRGNSGGMRDDAHDRARDNYGGGGSSGGGGGGGGGGSWGGGSSGSDYSPPPVSCSTHYHSCQHDETSCTAVFDHNTRVTLQLHFDPKAELLPGEVERFNFSLEGTALGLEIQKGRYVYEYPEITFLDMSGEQTNVDIEIKLKKVNEIKVENNIKLISAKYLNDGELQVVFKDPYFKVRGIDENRYTFLIMRFLRTYVRATVTGKQVKEQDDGSLVATIKAGDAGWKRAPRSGDVVPYEFSYWVERKSALFKEGWSKELYFKPFEYDRRPPQQGGRRKH